MADSTETSKNKLFEDDRRKSERDLETDRRTRLRPTYRLTLFGTFAATVILGLLYWLLRA